MKNTMLLSLLVIFTFIFASEMAAQNKRPIRTFYEDGKYGCLEIETEKTIIPAQFDEIRIADSTVVVKRDDLLGCYDFNGNETIELAYDWISPGNGLIACRRNGLVEVRNYDGSYFTQEKFEGFRAESSKVVMVTKNGERAYGVRYPGGKIELHPEFQSIHDTHCTDKTLFQVRLADGSLMLMDSTFSKVHDFVFEAIKSQCHVGYMLFKANGKWGIMDGTANITVPAQYEKMELFTDHIFARQDGKIGIISPSGEVLLPIEYDQIAQGGVSTRDRLVVMKDGLWGVVDRNYQPVLPIEFKQARVRYGQIFVTGQDGKKGSFDESGEVLLPIEYDDLIYKGTTGRLMILKKDGKFGLYNEFEITAPVVYDFIQTRMSEDFFMVMKDGKKGWLRTDGTLLNDELYDDLKPFQNGYTRALKDGKWLKMDTGGMTN